MTRPARASRVALAMAVTGCEEILDAGIHACDCADYPARVRGLWRHRPDSNRGIRVLQTSYRCRLPVKYDVLGLFLSFVPPRVPRQVGMVWERRNRTLSAFVHPRCGPLDI